MRLHSQGSEPVRAARGIHLVKRKRRDGSWAYYGYERKSAPYDKKERSEPVQPPAAVLLPEQADRTQESLGALIWAYQLAPEYTSLNERTKRAYAYRMRELKPFEKWPIHRFTREVIIEVRNKLAREIGNGTALAFCTVVYALFRFAEDNGWVKQTPARRLMHSGGKGKKNLLKLGEHTPWTPAEYALACRYLPEHVRRGLVLLRYTGQRLGDCMAMTWEDFSDDLSSVALVQEKTDERLWLPVHPKLRAELLVWRKAVINRAVNTGKVIQLRQQAVDMKQAVLLNTKGEAWNAASFGESLEWNLYHKVPGFPRKASTRRGKRADGTYSKGRTRQIAARSAHGLRYMAAILLAEADCTLKEIMAVLGHRTVRMAMKYMAQTDQKKLATSAFQKLISSETLPPTPERSKR